MKLKQTFLLAFFLVTIPVAFAQPYKTVKIYRPYKWMFGVHMNMVEDDGHKFDGIFDVNNSWNVLPFPSRLTIDRYFKYGWSIEGAISYTQYKETKTIHDTTDLTGSNFSFDINGKMSLYNLYAPRLRWFDPYFTFGVGYTHRDDGVIEEHVPTVNLGGGINFWILYRLGIQISSQAKFACYPTVWDTHANYLHHSIGIVYRTPWESGYQYPNNKKQHKWTKEQQRYKRKGGH